MFNKKIFILLIILIGLIIPIVYLTQNRGFKPPKFDETTKVFTTVPDKEKILKISDDYAFYIADSPYVKNDYIYVNFYSLTKSNIYLKVRVFQDDVIIAESGLIKNNEYLEKIKLKHELTKSSNVRYLIMSYEKDTYYSMGEVQLNFKMEEK